MRSRLFGVLLFKNGADVTFAMQHADDGQQFGLVEIVDPEIVKPVHGPGARSRQPRIAEVPGRAGGRGRHDCVYRVIDGPAKPPRDVDKSLFAYHPNCRRMSVQRPTE